MSLSSLPLGSRWTFVGGKGGVGKTTTAAALALELARSGRRTLLLSVDPAHSLADALGVPLGPEPREVPGVPGLRALEVDADHERERFLSSHRGSLVRLLERGTYLDAADAEGLTDLAIPGVDEIAALFLLAELADAGDELLVVDTAPTGHTLRLLDLPRVARGWLDALRAMEEKHREVALALAGAYRTDAAGDFLGEMDEALARVEQLLRDPEATRFLLVTTQEPGVLAETRRYEQALTERGIALAGIVVNRAEPGTSRAEGEGMLFVPRLGFDPVGVEGLEAFAAAARAEREASEGAAPAGEAGVRVDGAFEPPRGLLLHIVGGKGGVGKSTAAAALAVRLAGEGRRTLLLSTDPAGSLSEVLAQPVGADAAPVEGVEGLDARQLEASAAWEAMRTRYREDAARFFSGLAAAADRRVVERLIDLAPPGIDELVAVMEVVDWSEDRLYDALVLDTAPTGHLLRLLELPALALEWVHALLRLLLKYREVLGLGEVAERALRLSRELHGLRDLLADPARCWFLAVALPEPLSVPETERLMEKLPRLGVAPGALLVNRALATDGELRTDAARWTEALCSAAGALPVAAAPGWADGPAGAAELARFTREWRMVTES